MKRTHCKTNGKILFVHLCQPAETWKIQLAEVVSVQIQQQFQWAVFQVLSCSVTSPLYRLLIWEWWLTFSSCYPIISNTKLVLPLHLVLSCYKTNCSLQAHEVWDDRTILWVSKMCWEQPWRCAVSLPVTRNWLDISHLTHWDPETKSRLSLALQFGIHLPTGLCCLF